MESFPPSLRKLTDVSQRKLSFSSFLLASLDILSAELDVSPRIFDAYEQPEVEQILFALLPRQRRRLQLRQIDSESAH